MTKARSLFYGHYQPHLPTDFGFYDLRVRETRREQIRVAKRYGIDGFCYHYYWFSGTRLLDQPVDDMLADPESDMPFCLCWANENWTRRWDAAEHEILMEQKYEDGDIEAFADSLLPFLSDSRYIRIDGKPIIVVYRPQQIPEANESVQRWRKRFRDLGIGDVHLCAALTHGNREFKSLGFDAGVEFPPHNLDGCSTVNDRLRFFDDFEGRVVEYSAIVKSYLHRQYDDQIVYRTIFPAWDNTARAGNRAVVALGASPEAYEAWLNSTLAKCMQMDQPSENLVFINAWNEWAEGCHLEPDRKYGTRYLEATLRAKTDRIRSSHLSVLATDWSQFRPRFHYWHDLRKLHSKHMRFTRAALKRKIRGHPYLYSALKRIRDFFGG